MTNKGIKETAGLQGHMKTKWACFLIKQPREIGGLYPEFSLNCEYRAFPAFHDRPQDNIGSRLPGNKRAAASSLCLLHLPDRAVLPTDAAEGKQTIKEYLNISGGNGHFENAGLPVLLHRKEPNPGYQEDSS